MMTRSLPSTVPSFIWSYIRPHMGKIVTIYLVMTYVAGHLSLEPYLLKVIIDRVTTYRGPMDQIWSAVLNPVILFMVTGFVFVGAWRLFDLCMLYLIPTIRAYIMEEMFRYISHHSYRFFQENFAGSLSTKISDMSSGIQVILQVTFEIIRQSTVVLIGALVLLTVHPYFSLIILLWFMLFLACTLLGGRFIIPYASRFGESRSLTFGRMVDSITNMMNIRLFARHRFEKNLLRETIDETVKWDRALRWRLMALWACQGTLCCLLVCIMVFTLIQMRSLNLVTPGDFALIMMVAIHVLENSWLLTEKLTQLTEEYGKCNQALSIIKPAHEIVDHPEAQDLRITEGAITFKDVSFGHHKDSFLFQDLKIHIPGGQKVGLVGYSGSGKTTFANLILRLFDVNGGEILVDQQNTGKVTQDSLRSMVSIIPQEPVLFHRSLLDNIRYGRLEATEEEVIEASKAAHCHEFIEDMAEGYQTLVGERGIKLSGGQRQRIAIARALLKNAPILILDEATSALDSVTEGLIQDSLHNLMSSKTVMIIAHRLSTLLQMDRILVFHHGKIVEDGPHEELMALNGMYKELWSAQVGGFLPDQEVPHDL